MDSDDEMDLMAIRARNMAQINNMFGDIFSEAKKVADEVKEEFDDFAEIKNVVRQKRKSDDEIFRFSGMIPTERRKSARLTNSKPKYSFGDLDKLVAEDGEKDPDFFLDLEEIIREPVQRRKSIVHRSSAPPPIRKPEDISETELRNIATKSGNKTYSQTGTSCHQCRQKTVDTKTHCRSRRCVGVRGQFCGPCLKNRYGENAREALLDPTWACPPCRNLCNCSICRTREGKRPTGILAPTVQQEGYTSVKDFLLNLAEKGILKEENNNHKVKKSPEKRNLDDVISTESSKGAIEELIKSYIKKIQLLHKKYDLPNDEEIQNLLGFTGDYPTHEIKNGLEDADLLGFTKNDMNPCLLRDNIAYV